MFEDAQYLYQVWKMKNGKRNWGMLIDYAGLCMFMVLDTNTVQVRYAQTQPYGKHKLLRSRKSSSKDKAKGEAHMSSFAFLSPCKLP